MTSSNRNVVLLGDYDYDYPREKLLRRGFEQADTTVHECRFSETSRFIGIKKLLLLPLFWFRIVRRMGEIRDENVDIDALVLTKFNPLLIPLAAYYARRLDCPLVYDLFVSLYRTAEMRDIHPVIVRSVAVLERLVLKIPDHHLVGTDQFIDLYSDMYGIPKERFVRLPPGADEDWFYPREEIGKRETFTVLYWGNFLPHHGVGTIIGAAAELRDEPYEFVFLGSGPEQERYREMAEELALSNVRFEGFVPREDQQEWIASSHVALGVFADDPRSLASITNKVSEAVASKKAVITEESPAISDWFEHGKSIYTVPPKDPVALADAIETLAADPDLVARLEDGGYEVYRDHFDVEAIGAILGDRLFDD
ncbi:glycosyltransferase family 4 protein [Haloplanus halobius]|uniref:glycosyltransferase family 4 protein n=1 Tax=Haloplanus halobius TaxID=2934938 RepID=UPI00200D75C9